MKRQKTTGLAPSAMSGLSSLTDASSFGSARFGEALGLRHKRSERPVLLEAGGRLDIDRVALVGVLVEHLLLQPIGIGGKPVAQRARGGGGRGADAAHQRQRAPEGEPAATLIRPGALDHAEAVIEHGVMEGAMRLG